ncbi:hypothetical protein VPHG_00040 [Vibrio phage 11895-B1]|uniref:hypothetical protein n=1 Tax=Vibrio phage 11895-B1 TaxID=754075 RepID=UPI0002C10D07|nr:hypothetical protein VPHG_00040 [Vibrio phage 11895-B1]AGH32107.1 hypothetical protein VPHG_00040 [Vibrio phage 11895-B1]
MGLINTLRQTLETIGNYLRDEIDHLLWDAPVYCRLEIDEDEFNFDEHMEDLYTYDKGNMIKIFTENCDKSMKQDEIKYIVEWLEGYLPDIPEYR